MRTKECEVCGIEFYYRNKSKKTCSDSCRQQAYRDRKTKVSKTANSSVVNVQVDHNVYEEEFNGLILNLLHLGIKQTLSFFNGDPIHESEIRFLGDIVDTMEFHIESNDEPSENFLFFQEFVQRMLHSVAKRQDENGYINFRGSNAKKELKRLKRILGEGQ